MAQKELLPLKRSLKTEGNLSRPVPAQTQFATLPREKEFRRDPVLEELPYPPLANDSGCEFDPETGTLTTKRWGRVRCTAEGITVEQPWDLSSDKMILMLTVHHQTFNGGEITTQDLLAIIPDNLKEIELDDEALITAMAQAKETNKSVPAIMARGLFPQSGEDGVLKLSFETKRAAGTLREDGSMDFRERGGIHFVSTGDMLGELRPPVSGKPGKDIFGNVIPPQQPKPATVKLGKGVESFEGEGGVIAYRASADGVAHYTNGLLEVSDLLKIEGDIDMESGNIHSEHGSVHIAGNVTSGFTVKAAGDIIIDGVVEEANITAGGLVVAGGVIMNGKNTITAEGSVSAKFFQNATIRAKGDVVADVEFSYCDIDAKGMVNVLGNKGVISGGHTVSATGIHANIIGNESRSKTVVEIRLFSPKEEQYLAARNEQVEELERLDRAIGSDDALATLMNAPDEDRRILAELVKVRGRIQSEIRTLDEMILAEKKTMEEALAEKRIKAEQIAYGGTEVIIGGKTKKLAEDKDAPSFHLDTGKRKIVTE